MNTLEWFIPELSHAQWLAHGLVIFLNIVLFSFARPLLNLLEANKDNDATIRIFQTLNVLVFILVIIDLVFLRVSNDYQNNFIKIGLSLMTLYIALFIYSFCCYLSKKRFGTEKNLDDKIIYLDTYSTRLVDLLLLAVIVLTAIYAMIKIWGADSMLETTGIFGILIAFMAFTSNIWAPDIISGLVILNTQMLEDGDVVVVDGHPDEYIISKVSLVYVILYDVQNNHRTLIRNNQFIKNKIDNLSRMASTDGIRQALIYKISYPKFDQYSREDRMDKLQSFRNRVNRMFSSANENCMDQKEIKINQSRPFEWALTETGNHALEYTLWIYLERIPNTKVTSKIRKHLMGTIYKVNEAVYTASIGEQLDLSTPGLWNVNLVSNDNVS